MLTLCSYCCLRYYYFGRDGMDEGKVILVNDVGEFPIEVGQLICESSLEHVVLCDSNLLRVLTVFDIVLESDLSPLLLGKQMISLCIVSRLH